MTITTSLAKAFSFTFNPPSKTAVLPCNGNLSNQQIGSIVSNEWRFYAPANFMTLAVEQETARRGPTWRILGFVPRAIIKDGNGFGAVGNRIADLAYLAGQLKVSNLPFVLDPPSSVGSLQPRHVVRFHSFDVLDYQQRAGASIPVRQANWLPSVAGPLGVTLRAICAQIGCSEGTMGTSCHL